jgi:maleylpyruvate isomerase
MPSHAYEPQAQGMSMKLYNFFRSGTSHRLRIALNLKGLTYEYLPVDLRSEQHFGAEYKALNPQGLVPTLLVDGRVLTQTPAILEWLEECHPDPALLPPDPDARARVRALAAIVGCDIHPLNNRRILESLRHEFKADEKAIDRWCATWITHGFDAIEVLLASDPQRGEFCFGSTPTLADVYLVPQVESARRFKVDIARWRRIQEIDEACGKLDAFWKAAPAVQPDATAP